LSRVVLDEGTPEQIAPRLSGHSVESVRTLALKGTKNGKLLYAIEAFGFDAFISNDKRLEFDQNLSRRPFSVLLLSTNHWPTVQLNVGRIAAALKTAEPGRVTKVDCGVFIPRKFRKPAGPTP
jgi:hypothetical protein